MADIFISYSGKDRSIVKEIATLLETRGWTIWWDGHIPIGQRFDSTIESELRNAKCVLVIWTKNSVNSEWVKNEANDAAQRGVLVPVLLEPVALPLAFSRIEAALLTDWKGEEDHPELLHLFTSIEVILRNHKDTLAPGGIDEATSKDGISESRFSFQNKNKKKRIAIISIAVTAAFIVFALFAVNYSNGGTDEKNITVRIFDWKQKPVTEGEVKVYLDEYVRSQSIDKAGQALFTGIPAGMMDKRMKIEISSPGFSTRTFDTLLKENSLLELILPFSTIVFIRGRGKTAAEVPIKGVEINVDGTRYFANTITDGTYSLRLEEYTLGDEITLTTSHHDYEDKTIVLRINAPDIINQDIFLNPITR